MIRVALDSSVLVYAELEPDSEKGRHAADLILRTAANGVMPVQVLGEFLRVVQRRLPQSFAEAARQAAIYRTVFVTPPTTEAVMSAATELALEHGLQLWDAVICAASAQAGARVLLTEDLQDGRTFGTLRVLNPFAAANDELLSSLLAR